MNSGISQEVADANAASVAPSEIERYQLELCRAMQHEVCLAIEKLSASGWQTTLSVQASAVSQTIQRKLRGDPYKP